MTASQNGQSTAADEDSRTHRGSRRCWHRLSQSSAAPQRRERCGARGARTGVLPAQADPAVRSVLLRGEGPSFCSGRDKSGFLQPDAGGSYVSLIKTAQDIRRDQLAIGKPTLCAMQGHVIGAGAELALGCDMRIVADDLKFSLPEVGFGIVADTGSSTRLTALVGPARAKWMLISGASIGAEDALAWGLAEWRVPREALDQRAFELACIWRPDLQKPRHARNSSSTTSPSATQTKIEAGNAGATRAVRRA